MSAVGGVCSRGVSTLGGCLLPGGVCSGGVCSRGRGVVSQHALRQTPPAVNRMTNRCKNIVLATIAAGNKNNFGENIGGNFGVKYRVKFGYM